MGAAPIHIANGRLVDPLQGIDEKADILIRDGRFISIGGPFSIDAQTIDAAGCIVCPGFVDMHVHLREPGFENKETIQTGLKAAAAGGFTTVGSMPNTRPCCDNVERFRRILEIARHQNTTEVLPICSITQSSEGETLVDIDALIRAGCHAFSNDGRPVLHADVLMDAMITAGEKALIIDHCEDPRLVRQGVIHPGPWATHLGLPTLSPLAEELHIARDILLSEETGCPIHIAHLSTARGLAMIRAARQRNVRITCEVTPHHLLLSAADIVTDDANYKMNPPLRTPRDCEALVAGLADGTIDVVATDHAPHSSAEKAEGFLSSPFGIIGLETAVPLIMDRLVRTGVITLERMIQAMAIRSAALIGASPRTFQPGNIANVTIIDPEQQVVVNPDQFQSKSRNTPFSGWALQGGVRATIANGKCTHFVFSET